MSRGNWHYNYPRVMRFLKRKDYEFQIMDPAMKQQIRIIGNTCLIDLWPSKMTYHIIQSENPVDGRYKKLSFWFKAEELEEVLNG